MDMSKDFEVYMSKYGDLYTQELMLEAEAKAEAEEHLKKALEQAKREGEGGQGKLAGKLVAHTWETCRNNIKALLDDARHPKKTTQGAWLTPMKDLLDVYREREEDLENLLVLSGHSKAMDAVLMSHASVKTTLSNVAMMIGSAIKREADIERFYQWEEAEKGVDVKWLKKSLDKGIETRARNSYRMAYATNRMHKEGYVGLAWSNQETEVLGAKVLEMLIAGSDYYVLVDREVKAGKGTKHVKSLTMTEWFRKTWETNESKLIANSVRYMPMVIPPKPWVSPHEGGYYGESVLGTQLIRLKAEVQTKQLKAYNRKLGAIDLSMVYKALNAMQDTPFIINTFILKVLKDIYVSGGELGGVPKTEPYEKLPELPEGATEEEIKAHKKRAVGIYKQEEARKSKALRSLLALKVAEKFAKYDKIYFPWNVDYRGRCYPIPTALSPQGDDIQKSLLLFAESSPLAEGDDRWMAIHGANLSGNDKISFNDRVQWVMDNTTNIIASAEDPLGYTWWYEVSKGDYPMEFLAFCNEWKCLQDYKAQNGGLVKGFMSNLPLAFDGTCSGLQHFSALLRDEVGGFAVNLMPSDKVQDIYSIVAEKVNLQLLKDAQSGTGDEETTNKDGLKMMKYGTKTLAQNWVMFDRLKFGKDGITRKVCKRSVMTLAYGSKQYGFKENLLTDIIHPYVLDHPEDNPFLNPNQAAVYMAKLIWDAVATTVVKAVEGMEWLQKVARLICKSGEVVSWTTPNGFLVQQNYMKMKQEVIRLRFGGSQVRFYNQQEDSEIDARRQQNGISPNFIHSMDASHLQRVVGAEYDKGNHNFMMIHDSFGTDAAHAASLYKTIREEFIGLYKDQNHLQNFLDSVMYLVDDENIDKIPEIPSFGKLDLDLVAQSDFCFA